MLISSSFRAPIFALNVSNAKMQVFPLVYPVMYGFNVGETGLVFLCVIIAGVVAMGIYFAYLHFYLIPDILQNGMRPQEHRLVPALFFCAGPTIGLFLFGMFISLLCLVSHCAAAEFCR